MVSFFIVQEEHLYGNKQMSSSLTNGYLKNRIPYKRKDEATVVMQTIESSYSEPLLTPSYARAERYTANEYRAAAASHSAAFRKWVSASCAKITRYIIQQI